MRRLVALVGAVILVDTMFYAAITPLLPAAAIALLTISVNFVVDWALQITGGGRDGR